MLSTLSPEPDAVLAVASPAISASFSDALAGIGPGAVVLLVDGLDVTSAGSVTGTEVTYQPPAALGDGLHQVSFSVRDLAGNEGTASWSFIVDTTAPAITVTSPPDGATFTTPDVVVSGTIDDPAAVLTLNGSAVGLNGTEFHVPNVALAAGPNTLLLVARDAVGNQSSLAVHVTYVPPAPTAAIWADPTSVTEGESATLSWTSTDATAATIAPGIGVVDPNGSVQVTPGSTTEYTLTASGPGGAATTAVTITVVPAGLSASIQASPAAIDLGGSTTLSWQSSRTGTVIIEPGIGAVAASGTAIVSPMVSTTYRITAIDSRGAASSTVRVSVHGAPALPAKGHFGARYQDLIPADATISAYDDRRFALVTGKVQGIDGMPLEGVLVGIHGRPELGTASTDATGQFTLPVEGGSAVAVTFTRADLLSAHRIAYVEWNEIATVEPVVMLVEDAVATSIVLDGNPQTAFVHQGAVTTDEYGTRAATVILSGDTKVYARTEVGEVEVPALELRTTEYATPESMPAALPPESIYTYCVDVKASGLENVRFSKPVALMVENFLGLPVGMIVPNGYYDFDLVRWVPDENGVVVALLDTDGDGATDALDSTGDGLPDDLDGDGSTADEGFGLGTPQYAPGSTYWRARITHLSPHDLNHPWRWGIAADASGPNGDGPPAGDGPREGSDGSGGGPGGGGPGGGGGGGDDGDPKSCTGSYAETQARIYHDDLAIAGADFGLHYASNRVPGYRTTISVPASGSTVPASLGEIVVRTTIAGQVYEQKLPATPSQVTSFTWDGLDHLGRDVPATTTAKVEVGFVYPAYISTPNSAAAKAFGRTGGAATTNMARMTGTWWRTSTVDIHHNVPEHDLGTGWDLSIHHTMSPSNPTVMYKGDGSILRKDLRSVTTYAGDTSINSVIYSPASVAADAAGNVYVGDAGYHRVVRVSREGQVTPFAGVRGDITYGCGYFGDGGPAVSAGLCSPSSLAVDMAGNVYIDDPGKGRIRKVDTAGIIATVVGGGTGSLAEGYPALGANLASRGPASMTVDAVGNIYFTAWNLIFRVGADGLLAKIYEIAAGGAFQGLAVDREGNLYAAIGSWGGYSPQIHRISPDGKDVRIAGGGTKSSGEGIVATEARFSGVSTGWRWTRPATSTSSPRTAASARSCG